MIEKCFFVAVVTVLITAPSNREGEEELRLLDMKWSCLKRQGKTEYKPTPRLGILPYSIGERKQQQQTPPKQTKKSQQQKLMYIHTVTISCQNPNILITGLKEQSYNFTSVHAAQ